MSGMDVVGSVLLIIFVAACALSLVRLLAWIILDRKRKNAGGTTDEAFELARELFGNEPWGVQIIVSRVGDEYLASAHIRTRPLAVSSRRPGGTADEAVRLLCVSLRRALDSEAIGGVHSSERWVH